MNAFLKDLALHLYSQHKQGLSELMLVFPNRRAGLFFRKHLAEIIETPVWAPQIVSMEDFVRNYSKLQVADKISLTFLLYEEYLVVNPQNESFDKFYSWGEIMLKDFDDIDKYLVNPGHLFSSIIEQKEMEERFDYLTAEQRAVIKSFWSSFGDKLSSQQQGFLKIWNQLPLIYKSFRKRLLNEGIAYEGLLYRDVAEKCKENHEIKNNRKVVFAGFNALSTSEEIIIKHFIKNCSAQIFWDLDKQYIADPNQEAGTFLRKYAKDKIFGPFFPDPLPERLQVEKEKTIEITGVPLAVGQAKQLGEKLSVLIKNDNLKDLTNSVVVLPEENLLFPVLHSLPPEIKDINITMGYPLKDTSLNSLFEHLIDFQQQPLKHDKNGLLFHHKTLLSILKHSLIMQQNASLASEIISDIEKNNWIYIPASTLIQNDPFFKAVFRRVGSVKELISYLIHIILFLNKPSKEDKETIPEEIKENPQETGNSAKIREIEKEYNFQFYTLLNRLKGILDEHKFEINLTTFQKLYRQLIATYKLPFAGEPLLGLQIMGALETRNLDFENIFILSMNEGAFPAKSSANSYVPFNLRKGFGLPTIDQQDANYAYTFYRLLQRAKRVYLLHNTEVGSNINGEMSRYLFQLKFESNYSITEKILSNTIKPEVRLPITIEKGDRVLQKLYEYVVVDGLSRKRFTPSSLSIYLDCRLKFYYRYILGLHENDQVKDTVDPSIFGNILHLIMEELYIEIIKERDDKIVLKDDFDKLDGKINDAVYKSFATFFSLSDSDNFQLEGSNIIASEILIKYVKKILEYDKSYAPFTILGLEADDKDGYILNLNIESAGSQFIVGLKGIIDRIDFKDNVVRLIDYKTGTDVKMIQSIESLFDRNDPKRNKAAFQTIFYGLLFHVRNQNFGAEILPGIFNIREMFNEEFDFRLSLKRQGSRELDNIDNVLPYLDSFTDELQNLVSEIFDPSVPFDQTEDVIKCGYCPYSGICHKNLG